MDVSIEEANTNIIFLLEFRARFFFPFNKF